MRSSPLPQWALMFRLGTFGGLVLTDAAGDVVMPQRRRLAFLALLAATGERGLSRDKVLGYLWAESSSENARHALEQLLYSMRKQVSEPLFHGTDPLRLDSRVVQADVVDFARAMTANDPARAVSLYTGPFLDGFYLPGAPEFERWAEAERARLEAEHAEALRRLAADAHALGRRTVEIDLRRRLASADPLGERAAVGLVRALVEAGDWAGAMRHAREYEARIREELPGAPVTDLMELVRRMRGERPSRPTPIPGSSGEGSDPYVIEREIGRGSMATVYLARDRKHNREVALKVLRPEIAVGSDRRRFEREIGILARLHHPHILQLYDSGVLSLSDGREGLFYVMPHVDGETLRRRLEREGSLSVGDAVHIASEVADALAYAHAQGVIHRDIRPENILLESGHALVADFGIARALQVSVGEQISGTGVVLGQPSYMSPEQARGAPDLDTRTDIYSLGCVLYEMLAGEPPFTGVTSAAVLARQVAEPAPSLRTVCSALPIGVERAVIKALAKRPADRFGTAAEFATALRE
jgi:DNA-binding SARP family transcriptional activator/tRNA A-37 threonylcarbamoyl transferase component Bud32